MSDEKLTEGPEESGQVFTIPDETDGWRLAERAAWHALEKQGTDVLVMDLRGISDVCDFFVLATGTSDVHVKALARHLRDQLLVMKEKPRGIEGLDDGRWALLDFFDVVVHVFQESVRDYYQLEKLWGDSRSLEIDPEWFRDDAVKQRHPGLTF